MKYPGVEQPDNPKSHILLTEYIPTVDATVSTVAVVGGTRRLKGGATMGKLIAFTNPHR
jgi:hypothetical protein